jgi:1-acyl-sn-glycerol-3-phosphate acyltransferase
MMTLRSIIFYLFMSLWTLFIAVACSVFLIKPNKYLFYSCRIWSKGLLIGLRIICNIKYNIIGQNNLPKPPYIVASKHQSAFETILFWQMFLPPVYVLKKELTKIPFFGWYLIRLKMIYINRSSQSQALKHTIIETQKALDKNMIVVIFPEGTRTNPGHYSEKYFPGIKAIYSSSNVPVVPIALNSGTLWSSKKFTMKPGSIIIKILKPINQGLDKDIFMKQLNLTIENESQSLLKN